METTPMRPFLIQIGNRIINLTMILFIEIPPEAQLVTVNVRLADGKTEQFSGDEGRLFVSALQEVVWRPELKGL